MEIQKTIDKDDLWISVHLMFGFSSYLDEFYARTWIIWRMPFITYIVQARDLPKIVQAAYHLIPYFIFTAQEGEYCLSHIVPFNSSLMQE